MKTLQGLCVYPGLAMAKIMRGALEADPATEAFTTIENEQSLFRKALALTESQIEAIKVSASKRLSKEEVEIFEAHRMMLTDPEYTEGIESEIQSGPSSAAMAVRKVTETFIQVLSLSSSEYLRERVADLKDISGRLIRNLHPQESGPTSEEPFIYVGVDIAPSDLIALSELQLKGVVLAKGGSTSHASILMKAMGIPSIITALEAEEWLQNTKAQGDIGFLDSAQGTFEINPSADRQAGYEKKLAEEEQQKQALQAWKSKPSKLKSGESLPLLANVGNQKQLDQSIAEGAEGVGLYRTEFLFLDRKSAPTLEEQTEIYLQAVRALKGKSLVVRTLDIGGDKQVSYMNLPKEENPFLGVRGLRLCLEREELFLTQIRALLKASEEGPIDIMFPMVTDPKELTQAFALIEPLKKPTMKVRWGMMLEVPQNIFMILELSKHVEFFSVGTNDLTQYLTACDRQNPNVQQLNDTYSPGILRAMAYLAREVKAARRELSICGEMAADQTLLPFVVGLGVNKLSMSARMVARQRARLAELKGSDCQALVDRILACSNRSQVLELLRTV
ncbi:MAG: phosphoenolpyruvate--protein phosphotransferase [Bdellovibrionaceae bacterium]|nr:phosphoenolpyruvate--protein phosphotransferase [Pseudobdellovibrionaceae bacterium]